MTRKHYNMIADAIHHDLQMRNDCISRADVAMMITNALRGTNPRYQSHRFYDACMNGRGKKIKIKKAA